MFELPYIDEPGSNATSVSSLNRKTNTYTCFIRAHWIHDLQMDAPPGEIASSGWYGGMLVRESRELFVNIKQISARITYRLSILFSQHILHYD